jgi:hypothetical protein
VGEQVDPQDLGGKQRQRQAGERTEEHHDDLGAASGESVEQEAADVGVHPAAFLRSGDHRGEFVVREHEIRGLPGDLGAASAHCHADVRAAHRGGVVDSVAGHRHDVARLAVGFDDGEFLGGQGACEHARRSDLGLVHRVQVPTVEHAIVTGFEDARVCGDGAGGGRVVAGDQHRGDARGAARGDGDGGGGARRIEDRDQAEQVQVVFDRLRVGRRAVRQVGLGDGEHAQPVAGELLGAAQRVIDH